jgi:predicted alpha/beta hydrolase family esterase
VKRAIIIHGWAHKQEYYDLKFPTSSNSHWIPWVSKQLIVRDVHAIAPEMPNSFYPEYKIWKKEFERYEIDEETALVGHSCGGGFLVRWLSEHPEARVGNVVLVAPWMGIRPDQEFDATFFGFTINPNIAAQTKKLVIFGSSNDVSEIKDSIQLLREKLNNVMYREFEKFGHFTLRGMGTEEFPELVAEVVR